jgi:hypothetical protein
MNCFFISNATENNPLISPTVGAGSLDETNVNDVDTKSTDDTKPALASQESATSVNSQNKFTTNYAQWAGYKSIANYSLNSLYIQDVNEPAPTSVNNFRHLWLGGNHVQI